MSRGVSQTGHNVVRLKQEGGGRNKKAVRFNSFVSEKETISRVEMSTEEILKCYYQKMELYAMSHKFKDHLMVSSVSRQKTKKKKKKNNNNNNNNNKFFFLFRLSGAVARGGSGPTPEQPVVVVGDRKRVVEAVLREQKNVGSDEVSIAETYRQWSHASAARALHRGQENARNASATTS